MVKDWMPSIQGKDVLFHQSSKAQKNTRQKGWAGTNTTVPIQRGHNYAKILKNQNQKKTKTTRTTKWVLQAHRYKFDIRNQLYFSLYSQKKTEIKTKKKIPSQNTQE